MISHGGQNPLEPARTGNFILHGPNTQNFHEVYNMLSRLKISTKVNNANQIEKIVIKNRSKIILTTGVCPPVSGSTI